MKTEILKLLRRHGSEPISGEEIAEHLGVSRTAVWKNMQSLKKAGYEIEAVPTKGYVLRKVTNKILPSEIGSVLQTRWMGRNFCHEESIPSTNELCKHLASQGCDQGTVCLAEEQTGGKGRLSRGWFSPKGRGLWFSLLLKPPFLPQEASKCTLLAAVAVVQAVNSYKGVKATIKWPNDILLQGKKLVGILTEMSAQFGHINYIVVGMGINVDVPQELVPEEFRDSAISLQAVAQEQINRTELLAKILQNFEAFYEEVLVKGFGPVLDLWRQNAATLGKEVKVISPSETYTGMALDIDEEGLLIVEKKDGTKVKVLAGDVSIRSTKAERSKYE